MDNPYASPSSDPRGQDTWTGQGGITERVAAVMRSTQTWARIVAITGFIGAATALVSIVKLSSVTPPSRIVGQIIGLFISVSLATKLMAYASRIGDLLQSGRALDLEAALREHRKYWKIMGVLGLIVLGFLVLAFLFSLLGSSSSRYR